MSKTLDASTDLNSLIERIGVGPNEELRESLRRENYLRKFAALMSMDSSVQLSFNEDKAAVQMMEEDEDPRILIPTKEYEQPLTQFPRKAYDLLVQESLTLHEVGHILYSDGPHLKELREDLDEEWQPSFQIIWNAIEDGCIEAQLCREFNAEGELTILNGNLSQQNEFGHRFFDKKTGQDKTVYTMVQAMIVGLLNLGNYDSGHLEKIIDPDNDEHHLAVEHDQKLFKNFVPRMEEITEDAHDEYNAEKRNELIYEFFQDAKEILEKADVSGRKDQQAKGDFAPMEGKPDDAHEGIGEARMDMEEFAGQPNGGSSDNSDSKAMAEPDSAQSIEGKFEDEIRAEAESVEGGEALIEEMEKMQRMMKGASPGEENMQLVIPDFKEPRPEIWSKANNLRRRLRTILKNRLNWHRDKRTVRGQRRGKLDTDLMVRAARGDPRIFKQTKKGREKDYSCIIVQDRSGSMSGQDTDDAEVAVGAFSLALEDLGVDTMVLDFVGGQTRLAKPFGTSAKTSRGILSGGECGGGTPLAHATMMARERIEFGSGTHPFIIVVTDGQASDKQRYAKEVQACNFPVLGIYIRGDLSYSEGFDINKMGDVMSAFDGYTISTKDKSLPNCLYQLASTVML